jgi:hypothetical protein
VQTGGLSNKGYSHSWKATRSPSAFSPPEEHPGYRLGYGRPDGASSPRKFGALSVPVYRALYFVALGEHATHG